MAGFHNILVHNYLGNIDPSTIATVIDQHFPALQACMQTMLTDK
ncbi:HepT-like ribonuclease domain-containing protein [Thauera butanivorans]